MTQVKTHNQTSQPKSLLAFVKWYELLVLQVLSGQLNSFFTMLKISA